MKYKYMYIDESGDLGFNEKSSRFIIISALVIDDYRELDRIIKNMRRNKFKKEMAKMNELKAYRLYDYIENPANRVTFCAGFSNRHSRKQSSLINGNVYIMGNSSVTAEEMKRCADLFIDVGRFDEEELNKFTHVPTNKKEDSQ